MPAFHHVRNSSRRRVDEARSRREGSANTLAQMPGARMWKLSLVAQTWVFLHATRSCAEARSRNPILSTLFPSLAS